jgi:glycosyltransferase involved in cell wall biosynthesis
MIDMESLLKWKQDTKRECLCLCLMPPISHSSAPSVLDCNEFWSPSGGGVRRYHLQKMEYFRKLPGVHYAFLMPGGETRDEPIGENAVIAHVPAFKFPGNWEYRLAPGAAALREAILKHRPDVIEVGSPYLLPGRIRRITNRLPVAQRPRVVGFWHADFPVTYVGRFFARFGARAGRWAEGLAWKYARFRYNRMDAVFVPSRVILERLRANGVKNLHHVPLGVDSENFSPARRDETRIADLKAGLPERLTIFFGHRFAEEKGLRTFLKAYPEICRRLGHEPAVVFAGTGPDLDLVQAAVRTHAHMRYIGFVRDPADMAAWYASCEMGLALSGWETFGLSILEAMACGQTLVAADQGAAREHIEASGAGLTLPVADAGALASAVETLYRDRAGRDERAARAVAYARSLTWENCFDREMELYREIANGKWEMGNGK